MINKWLLNVILIASIGAPTVILPNYSRVTTKADVIADDSLCSLREAILVVNGSDNYYGCHSASTILLEPGEYTISIERPNNLPGNNIVDATYGDLDILSAVTIIGAGKGATVINANYSDRIFEIGPDASVVLRDLTISKGKLHDEEVESAYDPIGFNGGGIRNFGLLTLERVRITGNRAEMSQFGDGGGIANFGKVIMVDTEIDNNFAMMDGGGIFNKGELIAQNVEISYNNAYFYGGVSSSGVSSFKDCRFIANSAEIIGGGLSNTGNAIVDNCIFDNGTSYNTSPQIINSNELVIKNTSIYGGATMNYMEIKGGGLLNASGNTYIENSTISENNADLGGGVYSSGGSVTVTYSTIINNHALEGGGVYIAGGRLTLIGTILWNNTGGDCRGSSTSLGYNIIGSSSGCQIEIMLSDKVGLDPELSSKDPLTYTYTPLQGSIAIDRGTNSNCPLTDQLGKYRPIDGNGDGNATCDIGAVEATAIQRVSSTPQTQTSTKTHFPPIATRTLTNIPSVHPSVTPTLTLNPSKTQPIPTEQGTYQPPINTTASPTSTNITLTPSFQSIRLFLPYILQFNNR